MTAITKQLILFLPPKCVQSADLLGKGSLLREKQNNENEISVE